MKELSIPIGVKIRKAAQLLGMSANTLRQKSDLGEIPCKKIGRDRYYSVEALHEWVRTLPNWRADNGNNQQA